ncbi:MAG: hypothetical protein A2033_15180 [Bacteroidetes bacterium GWA2_31_9]|nr:MAG: hypothetical protein A2033_15180 [Bacteroidetes bacterium GWA2_31_9]
MAKKRKYYKQLNIIKMKTQLQKKQNSVPLCDPCASVVKKMRIALLSLVFSVLAFGGTWGQSLEWAKGYGSSFGGDGSRSIAIDAFENIYTTGSFYGSVNFGSEILTSKGNSDIFISKFDNSGGLLWTKQIGGSYYDDAYSIAIDNSGNIYTTGKFYNTVDFDPSDSVYNLTALGVNNSDIFISKLDSSGNFKWAKQIGSTGYDCGNSLIMDDSANVYITGEFINIADFDPGLGTFNLTSALPSASDIFILKLDFAGNFIWAKRLGGNNTDSGYSIALDDLSNVYTTGVFKSTADFNPGTETYNLTPVGYFDIFISKLDASGNYIWAKQIGGSGWDYAYSITVDAFGSIYTTGNFQTTADFDTGVDTFNLTAIGGADCFISKLDSSGNFLWAKQIGETASNQGSDIATDIEGNVYTTGNFYNIVDFDPGEEAFNQTSFGNSDIFISKLNSSGNFIWAKQMGGSFVDAGNSIVVDVLGNVYTSGYFNETADFDTGAGFFNLTSTGSSDIFILKLKQQGITGYIFNDINQNCNRDSFEIGIQNRFITINPGNIIAQTNESGVWVVDSLPIGTYTVIVDTSGSWAATCPVTQTFTVTNPNEITYVSDFGFVSTQPCAKPDVSIIMPRMNRCFYNQIVYVNACNQYIATGALSSAYADVELDSLIIPQSASLAYTSLGNNAYRFQLGTLNPGQCVSFTIDCRVGGCEAEILGKTLCMQASLYPADSCVFDTIPEPYPGNFTPCTLPWDKSSLSVKGWCQNDSIYFSVCNSGQDMDCFSPVRIYIDGVYTTLDSVQLTAGTCFFYTFAGDGRTWRLEADQHPLHPGNSHPNATVEACGNLSNWTPDLVNILPPNDADPIVDIYCGLVTGSYDPNDKTGYPTGLAYNHYIMPNQQLQYVIRFQNTGTDTAFTVVVRDTLDMDLDIFSVVQGVASHTYNFQMYGPRVLEWTFYNIQLPDSNHSEPNSHGFCTFTVNQNHDLANNTKITNSADIYFDYNSPITTNQTLHTVNDQVQSAVVTKVVANGNWVSEVMIYPNPASNEIFIEISNVEQQMSNLEGEKGYRVYGVDGKKVLEGKLESPKTRISTKELESGVYFVEVNIGGEKVNGKLVITR